MEPSQSHELDSHAACWATLGIMLGIGLAVFEEGMAKSDLRARRLKRARWRRNRRARDKARRQTPSPTCRQH
jgi:hypothetical protein